MPRQIIVDTDTAEASQTSQKLEAEVATPTSVITDVPDITITSEEMDKLFHEWDIHGKIDLSTNSSLADRIRTYLAYQEELDPLKEKLAERIYKPFLVHPASESKNLKIKANDHTIQASCYLLEGWYTAISLCTFKNLLIVLKNPYAPYITNSLNQYVDFQAYIRVNGGKCEWNRSYDAYCVEL